METYVNIDWLAIVDGDEVLVDTDAAAAEPIDWLAVADGPLSAPPLPPPPGPLPGPPPLAAMAILPRQAVKRKWGLPHPSKRSADQHALAASRMREVKAKRAKDRAEQRAKDIGAEIVQFTQENGLHKKNQRLTFAKRRGKVVGLIVKTSKGKERGFTWGTMLKIAYSPVIRVADTARVWKCDRATVRRIQHASASAFAYNQDKLLEALGAVVDAHAPEVFACSLAWDETSEQLRLPLHPGLLPEQQKSSWHVLVSVCECTLTYLHNGEER